ncbi:ABC transporter ATP-binding protein [Streptomyces sp. H27-D2]|uniref:ABC transporter ATP-binding protein n=1 Tax=Streptomyces sp. H27-D2 TaxID=3046304 RepID=UPI002DBA8781|nr:ABC transporter ATP-binding protein [Streptomyces sp. H27-D2]MEC4019274.1 ABC transporter ATP-binding protein [Streptomyces sp. H27-D2]
MVEVRDLTVSFPVADRTVRALDGLSFTLQPGRALGLVGESGSGKSSLAAALLDLHRGTGAEVGGTVRVDGTDVLAADDAQLRRLRGGTAAMVFQDPLSSLDPYYAIGDQIAEVHRAHRRGASRRDARAKAVEVLERVGIPDAVRRARSRPHEFSGGMRQRALIAMALACEPRLLIADEPTTALDVTVQAQILDLLHGLRTETGMGLILVTHDLGVVAGSVDEVLVMKDGREVESGPVAAILGSPKATYTRALLAAVPRVDAPRAGARLLTVGSGGAGGRGAGGRSAGMRSTDSRSTDSRGLEGRGARGAEVGGTEARGVEARGVGARGSETRGAEARGAEARGVGARGTGARAAEGEPLIEARGLRREFGRRRGTVTAVDGVSLTVRAGETLGIVGESGSGKTTLGRMLVRLLEPSGGELRYRGQDIGGLRERELRPLRGQLQMVFQDPVSSLNPRRSIGESIADPLRAAGGADDRQVVRRVRELLERVGLDPQWYHRYPHEFSGGQRQRVGIARALAPRPRLIVCDEPVSALDVTTQAQVVALLDELQRELDLALVFIAHDLAVVRQVSDRVAVMRAGRIVEEGAADEVYDAPRHPYTRGLLDAVPVLDPVRSAELRAARAAA